MLPAQPPDNEEERIALLRYLNILDTPIEERFERITRMLCRALNVPIAAVSLVDESRQWFKSIQGIDVPETPRNVAFCAHAILSDGLFIIPDATLDERFHDNPLVTGDPYVRFYAGLPLALSKDLRLGTLCAIDQTPRELSPDEIETMHDLARMVESELAAVALSEEQVRLVKELNQAQRAARIDGLTRLWNRVGIDDLLHREWDGACRKGLPIMVIMVDLDNFKPVNDKYGHLVGDEILRHSAQILLRAVRSDNVVGRWGGDEFMVILAGHSIPETQLILERLIAETNNNFVETSQGALHITFSMGVASVVPKSGGTSKELVDRADQALLRAKRSGKACAKIAAE